MDEEIERIRRKRISPPPLPRRVIITRRMNSIVEASAIIAAFLVCIWAVAQ